MTVYLLHLDQPLSRGVRSRDGKPLTAGHYIGYTEDLIERLDEHASVMWEPLEEPGTTEDGRRVLGTLRGHGARFMGAVNARGIHWRLARTWDGELADRKWERKLKNVGNAPRLCPICNPNALNHMKLPDPEPKPRRRRRRLAPVEDPEVLSRLQTVSAAAD